MLLLAVRQVQDVVEEPVFAVPELDFLAADVVHRAADVDEMLEELAGDVFVGAVVAGQFERDRQHIQAVHTHPAGRIRLFDVAAGRQRRAPVENPDVIEAEKPALKDVLALGVFAIHPPGKIQQQFVKNAFQKPPIADAVPLLVDLINAPGRPGMDRGIHVAECPFIGRNLTVGVHIPFAQHEDELLLGERRVHQRERDAMKREIPGGIPGILPLIRHRDDIGVIEMRPIRVPAVVTFTRGGLPCRIALEPSIHIVVIELFAPKQSGKGLPLYAARVFRQMGRGKAVVELVRFTNARRKDGLEVLLREPRAPAIIGQSQADGLCLTGREREHILSRSFGAQTIWIHRLLLTLHDIVVKAVLRVPGACLIAIETAAVGVIFCKEQGGLAFAEQPAQAIVFVLRLDDPHVVDRLPLPETRTPDVRAPGPGVAKPDGRKQRELSLLRPVIHDLNTDAQIFRRRFGILDAHVEIPVLVEDTAVDQFELRIMAPSAAILLDQPGIGERCLRVLVQIFHVGMRRRRIEVEIVLLHILPVIAFVAGESEDSFFQDRVSPVPQGQGKADDLMAIANAGEAVLVPAIGTRPGLIMGERVPGCSIRAVVLTHRAPGALAQIGSPAFPVAPALRVFVKTLLFCRDRRRWSGRNPTM